MSFPDVPDSLTRFAYIFDINCCSRQEQFSGACHGCVWIARIVFLVLDVGVNSYPRICILVHFSYSKLSADWWLEMFATLFLCPMNPMWYADPQWCSSVWLVQIIFGKYEDQFSPDPSVAWSCLVSPVLSNDSTDVSDPHSFGCLLK